jgi:phosphoserine phosphatase RsbU/P
LSEPPNQTLTSARTHDFEDVFENAPCGYLLLTPEGRITKANATCARWIGESADALAGRHLRDLLPVAARIVYETNLAPILRLQHGFEEVALDLLKVNGERLPVLANASLQRDESNHPVEVRVILVRAAERRGYEQDLQKREAVAVRRLADEQAESVLREQFIAVLGHDLRNPLAAVSSGVRLLQRDPSKEKADLIAGMLNASVMRMTGMIENVLDFARGRLGGGISLQRGPADLENAIRQVIAELKNAEPGRRIDDRYDLPPTVNCDPARLSQMVSNLVGNALSHGDAATFVQVVAFTSGRTLEISVANGGAPIPEERMASLFDPFSYEPLSAPRQGLGLGLFIASEIAKSHGGELTACSSELETRFTFRMPLASA